MAEGTAWMKARRRGCTGPVMPRDMIMGIDFYCPGVYMWKSKVEVTDCQGSVATAFTV